MDGRYRATAAPPPRLRQCTGVLRVLAVLVLAGLWLMHGVSATTEAGCHGVPVVMSMSAPNAGSGSPMAESAAPVGAMQAGAGKAGAASGVRAEGSVTGHSGMGESCLSGQPPSPHDLLLTLLATLALLALACTGARFAQPPILNWSSTRRRGPPGPVGRTLLITVCVSRT